MKYEEIFKQTNTNPNAGISLDHRWHKLKSRIRSFAANNSYWLNLDSGTDALKFRAESAVKSEDACKVTITKS